MLILPSGVWAAPARAPVPVKTLSLQPQTFEHTLVLTGRLNAKNATTLSASVTEVLTAIHCQQGAWVKKGDLLLELTQQEEHAQVSALEAQWQQATKEHQRQQQLHQQKLASPSALEHSQLAAQQAYSQWQAALAKVNDRQIRAPFNGRIGLFNLNPGDLVRPGDVLLTLADPTQFYLDIPVPQALQSHIPRNAPFTAEAFNGGFKYAGRISLWDNQANPLTRSVLARSLVTVEEGEALSGTLLKVFIPQQIPQALVVPEGALIQEATQAYVYLLEANNTVRKQTVTLGARALGGVQVTFGLKAGDTLIAEGAARLTPGASVSPTAGQP